MKSVLLFRILFLLVAAGLGATVALAEDLGSVKARMEQRLSAVDGLKDRGVVGENNRGFLEVRGPSSPEIQKTVSDENSDRQAVYSTLAAQTGATVDAVGRRRANQIALASKRGVWIQAASGEWAQKG